MEEGMATWMDFFREHQTELLQRTGEHVLLTLGAVTLAALVAFPAAFWAAPRPIWRNAIGHACNLAQTVPSLALLAFLLPLLGLGTAPALAALTLYAMLPLVRNTLAALAETPQDLVEAGKMLGLTPLELLLNVHIPQGTPLLIAGLRTATVWSVGTATLGAFIGAGGLGDFINRGIALNNAGLLLLGAIPAAILALVLDSGLGWLEARARRWKNGDAA